MDLKKKITNNKATILWIMLITISAFVLYKYYPVYDPVIMKVMGDLVKVFFIYMAWSFSKEVASTSTSLSPIVYGKAIAICIFIALMAWGSYGTHTEGGDPMFGGGELIVDFVPTDKEKNEHGWTIFFTFLIPVILGVNQGLEEKRLNDIFKTSGKE